MKKNWRFWCVIILILSIPFVIRWIYASYTKLPSKISIATGPVNGQWRAISLSLSQAISSRCGVRVETVSDPSEGSLQHLELLTRKKVDFALYMRGARRLQSAEASDPGPPPLFVANLYRDVALFLVRRELYESGSLETPADLDKKANNGSAYSVAVGRRQTAEHSIAQAILRHYFGDQRRAFEEVMWDYEEIEQGFDEGKLDAAFIVAGHQAPVFRRLLRSGEGLCVIGEIPEVGAIAMKNVGLSTTELPRGLFRSGRTPVPERTLTSIASQTMLLTHEEVPSQIVEEVTKIILSETFVQDNHLFELSQGGMEFASSNPEFEVHYGANNVFEPQFRPLVDPEFMEATENLRSFGVSLLIGAFFAYRWYRSKLERRKDHRLDQYFSELLEIDRGTLRTIQSVEQAIHLQGALERVTALRDEALREFSAQDFDEDSAADSLIFLCESIAAGFRSRLLRWQLVSTLERVVASREENPTAESRAELRESRNSGA